MFVEPKPTTFEANHALAHGTTLAFSESSEDLYCMSLAPKDCEERKTWPKNAMCCGEQTGIDTQVSMTLRTHTSKLGLNRQVTAPCPGKFILLSTAAPYTNQLIDRLPAAAARSLLAACHPVELEFDQLVAEAGTPVARVLFPTTGIISVTAQVEGHNPLEMGMIGHEGMLGATLALGVNRHPMQAVVQGSGSALEISANQFRRQLKNAPALTRVVNGYLFVLAEQLSQTAACNAFHEVSARLARWLLMMDDRARGEPLVLTHLFLSDMLGVRRSAVTIAAGQLQEKDLIQYARGHIQVLSRPGLESIACDCYPAALAAYERQFGAHVR